MDTDTIVIIVLAAVIFVMILGFGLFYAFQMNKRGDKIHRIMSERDAFSHSNDLLSMENAGLMSVKEGLGERLLEQDRVIEDLGAMDVNQFTTPLDISEDQAYRHRKWEEKEKARRAERDDSDTDSYDGPVVI